MLPVTLKRGQVEKLLEDTKMLGMEIMVDLVNIKVSLTFFKLYLMDGWMDGLQTVEFGEIPIIGWSVNEVTAEDCHVSHCRNLDKGSKGGDFHVKMMAASHK